VKLLIAGAGGYLGIPIVNALLERGHYVVALDRWFFGKYPAPHPKLGIEKDDIRKTNILDIGREELPYEAVIDLAGLSNDLTSDIDPDLTRSINIEGGKRLATLAKQAGVKRYVYSSSASVYGAAAKPNLTETDECRPLTLYARSKVEVEDHLRSIAGDGFEPVILRNATVFGVAPRMRFDLAVNVMTLRSFRYGRIMVMGSGDQWRPFVAVKDVVSAFILAVEFPSKDVSGQTFNIGTSNLTIGQLAKKVKNHFPMAETLTIPDDPDRRSYSCSFDKINTLASKWADPVSIESEIDCMAKMLRSGELKDAPETYTLQYYKSLLSWEKRLSEIRLDGRIL
jgi:nucleoside-diphosphate-sugar epimerase